MKKYYTTSYILNKDEVSCKKSRKSLDNYTKVITFDNNIENTNNFVKQNIQNGGITGNSKLRCHINSQICSRLSDGVEYSLNKPFEYTNNIETEFYLLHGETSHCSKYCKKN